MGDVTSRRLALIKSENPIAVDLAQLQALYVSGCRLAFVFSGQTTTLELDSADTARSLHVFVLGCWDRFHQKGENS